MTKTSAPIKSNHPNQKRRHRRYHDVIADQIQAGIDCPGIEINVGRQLREIRTGRGLSMRRLAEQSGLNVNTLSLIESDHPTERHFKPE